MDTLQKLETTAMVVSLVLPNIQSVKTIKTASERVAVEEHTTSQTVRVVAATIPIARANAVRSALDDVRAVHTGMTLPFMGTYRLLKAGVYLDYLREIGIAMAHVETAIDVNFHNRAAVLNDAVQQMGSLDFDVNNVPTDVELKALCAVKPTFLPFSGMFNGELLSNLGIEDDQHAEIQAETARAVEGLVNEGIESVIAEVVLAVERVVTSLERYDADSDQFTPEGKKKRRFTFHGTMVTNIQDLVHTLPMVNLSEDPRILDCIAPLRSLAQYTADELKASYSARLAILAQAKDLLKQIDSINNLPEPDDMFGGLL